MLNDSHLPNKTTRTDKEISDADCGICLFRIADDRTAFIKKMAEALNSRELVRQAQLGAIALFDAS